MTCPGSEGGGVMPEVTVHQNSRIQCGPNADDLYCPAFWSLHAEREQLRERAEKLRALNSEILDALSSGDIGRAVAARSEPLPLGWSAEQVQVDEWRKRAEAVA